jgi:hypothetical protein
MPEETLPGTADDRALRLAVVAAVTSVLLVGIAVAAHAVGGPPVVWVVAALGALTARPVAVLLHRRAAS